MQILKLFAPPLISACGYSREILTHAGVAMATPYMLQLAATAYYLGSCFKMKAIQLGL